MKAEVGEKALCIAIAAVDDGIELMQVPVCACKIKNSLHGSMGIAGAAIGFLYDDAHLGTLMARIEVHHIDESHDVAFIICDGKTHLAVSIDVGRVIVDVVM